MKVIRVDNYDEGPTTACSTSSNREERKTMKLKIAELCAAFDEAVARYGVVEGTDERKRAAGDLASSRDAVRQGVDLAMRDVEGAAPGELDRHLGSLATMTYYCAWLSRKAATP